MKKIIIASIVSLVAACAPSFGQNQDTTTARRKGEAGVITTQFSESSEAVASLLRKVRIPKGTIVTLSLNSPLNSEDIQEGKTVTLTVTIPVQLDGQEVIMRGAYGEATVTEAKRARSFGRGGKIVLVAKNVQTFDGHRIALKGEPLTVIGNNRKGLALGLTIAGAGLTAATVYCVPFVGMGALVRGRAAKVEAGELLQATIVQDITVNANPESVIYPDNQ